MIKIFITGESGTIPMAMQNENLLNKYNFEIINSQLNDKYGLKQYKSHQSFKVRQPELDFTDRELLFSQEMKKIWELTDIIIHSGAFVGTDFCNAFPNEAIKVNVEGTKNIVDICNSFNIKLIYFSTTAIYDVKKYNQYKLITEDTDKNPQTLYGITKYAGEQIVEKLCKTDKLIIRPVFGFGNFPEDLHSALTKLIYIKYQNLLNNDLKLKILLNKNIEKTYTRVENLANIVFEIIKLNYWNDEFNIGDVVENSANWYKLYDIIITNLLNNFKNIQLTNLDKENNIIFKKDEDYLHWHNISTIKLQRKGILKNIDWISLHNGINLTIDSVIKNSNFKPYWI